MVPLALASDWACRTKVTVMDRACGEPPQAATVTVAVSTASATETFRIMLRLGMRDSLPCRRLRWEGFAMVSGRKALEFRGKEILNDVVKPPR
ncbi:hypothetical protein PICSAR235_04593 [Mycobacterium avium subsp. paratuberculosis]|nr:hypothetical protein PICSAR118_04592 [Mycobacterium avium subsp. paratuberculosis]CAG7210450.1 hypothetical protein PICSAR235_04593 [Mycobacterium avium subsp. paratuberculosis]